MEGPASGSALLSRKRLPAFCTSCWSAGRIMPSTKASIVEGTDEGRFDPLPWWLSPLPPLPRFEAVALPPLPRVKLLVAEL